MERKRLPIIAVLAFAAIGLAGCAQGAVEAAQAERAVTVAPVEDTDLSSVTLSEKSAERIGIETARVEPGDAGKTVVPYSAVLYDEHGDAWVYTNPEGLTFVRAKIEIDAIDLDIAQLADGPPAGTTVATVGVAELFGAEMGVGDPE